MPDYKKMYYQLFNAVTDALEALQQAQIEGEQDYLDADTPSLSLEERRAE